MVPNSTRIWELGWGRKWYQLTKHFFCLTSVASLAPFGHNAQCMWHTDRMIRIGHLCYTIGSFKIWLSLSELYLSLDRFYWIFSISGFTDWDWTVLEQVPMTHRRVLTMLFDRYLPLTEKIMMRLVSPLAYHVWTLSHVLIFLVIIYLFLFISGV